MADDTSRSGAAADDVRRLLTDTGTWAVVGWSPRPDRASHGVARFLRDRGKRVLPVNPTCVGTDAGLDAPVVASLADIDEPIDMVDVFRRPEYCAAHAREAVAAGAGSLWLQLGISSPEAREIAEDAGLDYVEDACTAALHARYLRA